MIFVKFKIVHFNPKPETLLKGVIEAISPSGLSIEIENLPVECFVASNSLMEDSLYHADDNMFIYNFNGLCFPYKVGSAVKFKVKKTNLRKNSVNGKFTLVILGRCDEAGLGPVDWWN